MSDAQLLDQLNSVELDKTDFLDLAEASAEYRRLNPEREDYEMVGMYLAVEQAQKDPHRAFAIMYRMRALAKIVEENGVHGWTLPRTPDGGIFMQHAVFAAAAVHPLVQVGKEWEFDRATFLDRVLELADSEARA